jgi:hypothetical protein
MHLTPFSFLPCILLPVTVMNHTVHVHTATDINETEFFMLQNTQGTSCVCLEYFLNIFWHNCKIFIISPATLVSTTGWNLLDMPYPPQQQACIA